MVVTPPATVSLPLAPLLFHAGKEQAAGQGLDILDHVEELETRAVLPSPGHDLAAQGIHGDHDPAPVHGGRELLQEGPVQRVPVEDPGPHDDPDRAHGQNLAGVLDRADSPAHPAVGPPAQRGDELAVAAAAQGRVKIDHGDLAEHAELRGQLQGRRALEHLVPALLELHGFAVHDVDAWYDHRTHTPSFRRWSLIWPIVTSR
jgi:hypothetical protein